MEFRSIRSGTKEALESKHYNIGVGISLGNKWFTPENIAQLVKWALQYTKQHVVVYVADSIHAINIEVRDRRSPMSAVKKAMKLGDDILKSVKERVDLELSDADKSRIYYAKWEELHTDEYNKKLEYLYGKYENDTKFKGAVLDLVEGFVSNEVKQFSKEDKVRLGSYIIEELPEIVSRRPIGGIAYDAYAYPHDGELPKFVEMLQSGEIFPEIRENIMDTEPRVFIEVR